MPFTLAHPAAAVPLARRGLVLSALVVGSMAPDFQYTVNFTAEERFSHSWPGIFLFCLPAGLVVLWLFHYLLKFPLLSLFPISHQQRLLPVARRFECRTLRQFLIIASSLILGTLTHIVWDSFTHVHGWVFQQWPHLNASVVHLPGFNVRLTLLLQYGSSIVGILLLLGDYIIWFRKAPVEPVENALELASPLKWKLLGVMALWAGVLAILYGLNRTPDVEGVLWYLRFVRYTVIGGMSVIYIELLLFSIGWHLWRSRNWNHG